MRAYRAGNGRIIVRAGNGRFVRLFLGDVIPNVNAGEVTCCESSAAATSGRSSRR